MFEKFPVENFGLNLQLFAIFDSKLRKLMRRSENEPAIPAVVAILRFREAAEVLLEAKCDINLSHEAKGLEGQSGERKPKVCFS